MFESINGIIVGFTLVIIKSNEDTVFMRFNFSDNNIIADDGTRTRSPSVINKLSALAIELDSSITIAGKKLSSIIVTILIGVEFYYYDNIIAH